jgi:DNA-directed RNA polymerase specialized sigma24 family protein
MTRYSSSRIPFLSRIAVNGPQPAASDPEWAALMARAQEGDKAAYHQLLQEVTPYLRSLAARRHSAVSDVEDAVQDILLTIHSIRQTCDPARPFAPWLAAIANQRFIDRLRGQGATRGREVALTAEHESFSQPR